MRLASKFWKSVGPASQTLPSPLVYELVKLHNRKVLVTEIKLPCIQNALPSKSY